MKTSRLAPRLRRLSVAAVTALGIVASAPTTSDAQPTRGVVADERGAPVAGVVVLLVGSDSAVVMRSLTNDRGEYRLVAPHAGEFRVRTLRIGFRPSSYGPFPLDAGAEISQRLVLTGLPVSLGTMTIVDEGPCRALGDPTAATFMVWEQVRTALTAAQITEGGRPMSFTTVLYERFADPRSGRVVDQSSKILVNVPRQPWRTILADSLHRKGYILEQRDGSLTYYAPGLEVLLSDMFLQDHCFRMRRSTDPERIGIQFEPIPTRNRIPEIRGTIWIDRASSQLRRMEFGYTNTRRERSQHAGGHVEYVGMQSGEWVISGWEIRMPIRAITLSSIRTASAAIKVDAGELVMVQSGSDTLWARRPEIFRGTVIDSSSGNGVPGARVTVLGTGRRGVADAKGEYAIDGVLYGGYLVEVATASLDSVADIHLAQLGFTDGGAAHEIRVPNADQVAATACAAVDTPGPARSGASPNMIAGIVRTRGDSSALPSAWVTAEWRPPVNNEAVAAEPVRLQEVTDARGMFRFCGIPANADVTLRVQAENHGATQVVVRVPVGRRFVHVPLLIEPVR